MTDVFITRVGAVVPHVDRNRSLSQTLVEGIGGPADRILDVSDVRFEMHHCDFDPDDPHIPRGREAKIIRRDVELGLVAVGRLLDDSGLDPDLLRDAELYLATGLSQDVPLESRIEELWRSYVRADDRSESERNAGFFRGLPPLMALAGLSNAAACFIARQFGVRGPNTVFGVTSHSGHSAIREGFHRLAGGAGRAAIVGGTNGTGMLSALTLSPFGPRRGNAIEAECAAFLLLETAENLSSSSRFPLCRIAAAEAIPGVPTLSAQDRVPFATILGRRQDTGSRMLFFGGSLFDGDNAHLRRTLDDHCDSIHSWYGLIGSPGSASVGLDVATAAQMLEQGLAAGATCFNRDPYGRESLIQLEALK